MSNQTIDEEANSTSISEIDMISNTNSTQTQANNFDNTKESDIRNANHFETRNRKYHHINPYNIVNKGNYIAGTFVANVPGDNKWEQISYLANLLKLPEEEVYLIQTIFSNGNG